LIEDDLAPVRPVASLWLRVVCVAAVAVAVVAISVVAFRIRVDLYRMPFWIGWGASVVELVAGIGLVALALRESIPGRGVPVRVARLSAAGGLLLQVAVGIVTWLYSPGKPLGSDAWGAGMGCLRHDFAIALPTFVVAMLLIFRALPMRAPMAGLVGATGAAITGDAVMHLLCPVSDLRHVLLWHSGALVLYMIVGWLLGRLWERLRWGA
jgi:hypothetical protein